MQQWLPVWSTDFECISADAEWKTAHLLVPLGSQLVHLFLFLIHDDPLVFLAPPSQASLFAFDSVDLWSVRFSCVLCSAVSRIAKRYHWWHVKSSTRIHTLIWSVDLDHLRPTPPPFFNPKKAGLGLSSVDLRWTVDNLPLVLDGHPNLLRPAANCYSFDNRHTFCSLNHTTHTRQPPPRSSHCLILLVVCDGYIHSTSRHRHQSAIHSSCGGDKHSLIRTRPYLLWKEELRLATAERACLKNRRLSTASPAIHLQRHATVRPTSTGEPLSKTILVVFISTQYRSPR